MQKQNKSLDLSCIVVINEQSKCVIDISRQIGMVAINAGLISRRAGDKSAGFRVLAIELRKFSENVGDIMSHLDALILKLVRDVAQMRKFDKKLRLLTTTIGKMPDASSSSSLNVTLQHWQTIYDNIRANAEDIWGRLEREVGHSLLFCKSGAMLTHNVRIEASYGDDRTEMQNISHVIEGVMERLNVELRLLNTTLIAENEKIRNHL